MSTPEDGQAISEKVFVSESESGIKFHTYHVERTVKIYPIQESELRSVSMLNTLVIVTASLGTGLLTYIIGLFTDALMQEILTPSGQILLKVVAPLCGILCVGFYGVAIWGYRSRKTELDRILDESQSKS